MTSSMKVDAFSNAERIDGITVITGATLFDQTQTFRPEVPPYIRALASATAVRQADVETRKKFFTFLGRLREPDGTKFVDLNKYEHVLEIRDMLENGKSLREIASTLAGMSKSGEEFIWSLPGMQEQETKFRNSIKKEFEDIEGVELPVKCKECGGTRYHQDKNPTRGDETMVTISKCLNCGWVFRG